MNVNHEDKNYLSVKLLYDLPDPFLCQQVSVETLIPVLSSLSLSVKLKGLYFLVIYLDLKTSNILATLTAMTIFEKIKIYDHSKCQKKNHISDFHIH